MITFTIRKLDNAQFSITREVFFRILQVKWLVAENVFLTNAAKYNSERKRSEMGFMQSLSKAVRPF